MDKEKTLERLDNLRKYVENSESCLKLAKISYKKYLEDMSLAMLELDEIEKELKEKKSRSWFDLFFGNPMESIENNFNNEVHDAIDDIEYGQRSD